MAPSGDLGLSNESLVPKHLWDEDDLIPPKIRDVLTQIAHFLDQLGFTNSLTALLREAIEQKLDLDLSAWEDGIEQGSTQRLMDLWAEWFVAKDGYPTILPSPKKKAVKGGDASLGAQDAEDEESSSSSEDAASETSTTANTSSKRKRVLTPPSSDDDESDEDSTSESEGSDENDDSSSDESDTRPAKRAKTTEVDNEIHGDSGSDGESDDSSSDSSESEDDSIAEAPVTSIKPSVSKVQGTATASSTSSDASVDSEDSSSESGSSSESDTESDATSESSSESESEADDASDGESVPSTPSPTGKVQKSITATALKVEPGSSSSSTTLEALSPPPTKNSKSKQAKKVKAEAVPEEKPLDTLIVADETTDGMHPDRIARMPPSTTSVQGTKKLPATKENIAALKKGNVPFSRIPADTKVDPRFASNEYVSYDYADRAYQDLAVTKGKGFTKEKNKKKRGAYRGGAIDLAPKGIKFED